MDRWKEEQMTEQDKTLLTGYRQQGKGCTEIARLLGVSVNTVKSYCRRNGIGAEQKPSTKTLPVKKGTCKQCGAEIEQVAHHRERQFCSDQCRMRWWHTHRSGSRSAVEHVCPECRRTFMTDRVQKYCSHECYILSRFGRKDAI